MSELTLLYQKSICQTSTNGVAPSFVPYGKIKRFCLIFAILSFNLVGAVGEDQVKTQNREAKNKWLIMINNTSLQKWFRLEQKNLDKQFIHQIIEGCNCSSFEAKAILETVHEVFAPFFNNASSIKPGQIQLPIVSSSCPPGTALNEAPLITALLTLCDDTVDLKIRQAQGVVGLRQFRLQRVCTEAFQQGGLLTVEDLAHRLFNCGQRTICRDIKELKEQGISLPLRSTVKDMGRSISHRKKIIQCWLLGDEYDLIARKTFHSRASVQNYVSKFKRVIILTLQGFDIPTISFLVKLSFSLVTEYQNIYQTLDIVQHREEELNDLLKKNNFKNL